VETVPAREIKRRGISALDEALERGPVHVVRKDHPAYVVLRDVDYRQLIQDLADSRLAASEADLKEGRFERTTPERLLAEIRKK
jgi:hypothetical protein